MLQQIRMSIRHPTPNTQPPRAASNANRLSQVLAAGLEQKLSLETCRPCQPAQRRHAAAPINTVLDYKSEEQLREAGARFLAKECPEDDDDCNVDEDGIPFDPISYDHFQAADGNGREREASRVMILGCGHAFTLRTVRNHNINRAKPVCPMMRTHGGADGNYYLNDDEVNEMEMDEMGGMEMDNSLTRRQNSDGSIQFYRDSNNGPKLVKMRLPNGNQQYYEGQRGEESLVRLVEPDGATTYYYLGTRGEERVIRKVVIMTREHSITTHYQGPGGEERAVMRVEVVSPDDQDDNVKTYYEGPKGEERVVTMEFGIGDYEHYLGPRGQERMVRREDADGDTTYYEGPQNEERIVRQEDTDGNKYYFEGPRGQELMVRTEDADGTVVL